MSFKSFRLIFCLITVLNLIALGLTNSEQCFYVYVCCQRDPETFACVEYCPPSFECGNHLVESNDDNLSENGQLSTTTEEVGTTTKEIKVTTEEAAPIDPVGNESTPPNKGFHKGNFTAVIDTKLCRMGMRLVAGRCKRVF